jgi:hypothetical protein
MVVHRSLAGFNDISSSDARVWLLVGCIICGLLFTCAVTSALAWRRILVLRHRTVERPVALDKRTVFIKVLDGLLLDVEQLPFCLGLLFFSFMAPCICLVWILRRIIGSIAYVLMLIKEAIDKIYDAARWAFYEILHHMIAAIRMCLIRTKLYRLYCGCYARCSRCSKMDAWCISVGKEGADFEAGKLPWPLHLALPPIDSGAPISPLNSPTASPSRLQVLLESPRFAVSPHSRSSRVADFRVSTTAATVPTAVVLRRNLANISLDALWQVWSADESLAARAGGEVSSSSPQRPRVRRDANGAWEEEVSDTEDVVVVGGGGGDGFFSSPPPPSAPSRTVSMMSSAFAAGRSGAPRPSAPTRTAAAAAPTRTTTSAVVVSPGPRPSAPSARTTTSLAEPGSVSNASSIAAAAAASEPQSLVHGTDPSSPLWPDDPPPERNHKLQGMPPPTESAIRAMLALRR